MAGTGQGALQPTKLVQTDDFMETIAPPGYFTSYIANVADATTIRICSVPDGMTAEVIDFGITAGQTLVTSSGGNTSSITFNVMSASDPAIDIMTTADIAAGATIPKGTTMSALRKSTGYTFTAASTAVSNQFGPGAVFEVATADTAGSGATGSATVWVRLKWISKDTGDI